LRRTVSAEPYKIKTEGAHLRQTVASLDRYNAMAYSSELSALLPSSLGAAELGCQWA